MVDPRMPTDPVEPSYAARRGTCVRLCAELWDHVWPWRRGAPQPPGAVLATGVLIALAATFVWVLAATGRVESGAVIGWWFSWSVYEVIIRLGTKRYVKDGPWWGQRYRVASVMDMLSYVSFKNLLIGAALFLVLKSLGLLAV